MDVFFLQVFVFTDGEVTDTFTVVREVKSHLELRLESDKAEFQSQFHPLLIL